MTRSLSIAISMGLVCLIAALVGCVQSADHREKIAFKNAVPYNIVSDHMDTVVKIGLDSNVNEVQLRDTLAKAADDHQDDAARDYLSSSFLWIEAYLVKEVKTSSEPAGRLKRYIPWKNPEDRKKITADRSRADKIFISLDLAKRTLIVDPVMSTPMPVSERMPNELWGHWIVKRNLPVRTISCWGQEEVNKLIGTELEYSPDLFRWNSVRIQVPRILIKKMSAQEFHDFHSGGSANGSQVTLQELGISSDHVEIVSIQHLPADITGGTIEIPGDYVIAKNENTIVFPVCNVWFEANRDIGKK